MIKQENTSKSNFIVYIPTNVYKIEHRYYNLQEIINLLRKYKNKPNAIQFIADMLE